MSFKDCTTREEAEARFRTWAEALAFEALATFPPDILADYLDEIVTRNDEAIELGVQQFRAILDREGIAGIRDKRLVRPIDRWVH